MGKEYATRSFKSGNSVAIRIPAALGVEADQEWSVAQDEDGSLVLRSKLKAKRKFDVDAVWGCAKGYGLRPIERDDRVFEERKLIWDDPDWPGNGR